ncbi:MAG TPA: hypothetical protein VFA27_04305 [Vicinamibacterales bacterium]|nr:hypothetical protein [Vicinamibacterales bacterium]
MDHRLLVAHAVLLAALFLLIANVSYTRSLRQSNPSTSEPAAATQAQRESRGAVTSSPFSGSANSPDIAANQRESKAAQFVDKFFDPIVWVSLAVAFFTFLQVGIYRQMRDHTIDIERAYVDLSHNSPGIADALTSVAIGSAQSPTATHIRKLHANVGVINNGNTPGHVERVLIHEYISTALPADDPPYQLDRVKPAQIHLVKNARFNIGCEFPIDVATLDEICSAAGITDAETAKKLFVIGFADYTDKFGRRHRAGYARVYKPEIDRVKQQKLIRLPDGNIGVVDDEFAYKRRNNLHYVVQPGYNYDWEIDDSGNRKT